MARTCKRQTLWTHWLSFCLLCFWGATRWLLPSDELSTGNMTWVLLTGSLLAALCAWGLALRGHTRPVSRHAWLRAGIGGVCLMAGLQLPVLFHVTGVSSTARTIALALCPVVIAVADSAYGYAEAPDLPGRLWPGLAAMAGLLLLLPEPSFANWRQTSALTGMPLLAGVGAALIGSIRPRGRRLGASALTGASLAAFVAIAFPLQSFRETATHFALTPFLLQAGAEAVSLLLMISVLSNLGAVRWAASLVLVPLLVAIQGVVLMRPELGSRAYLGMGLLGLASLFLLWNPGVHRNDVVVP